MIAGHRKIAALLHVSLGHVSNVLDQLSAHGRITVEAGRKGTRVRLIQRAAA